MTNLICGDPTQLSARFIVLASKALAVDQNLRPGTEAAIVGIVVVRRSATTGGAGIEGNGYARHAIDHVVHVDGIELGKVLRGVHHGGVQCSTVLCKSIVLSRQSSRNRNGKAQSKQGNGHSGNIHSHGRHLCAL